MNKKIIFIILATVSILSIFCISTFATTIGESVNYQEIFAPTYIVLSSHDEIVISNSNQWNGAETTVTSVSGGAYTLDIDAYGNFTTYTLDDYFNSIDMAFDQFHVNSITDGPWLSNYFSIECYGNDQLLIDVFVYYEVSYYLGDGSLMTVERTDYIQSPNNRCEINVRQYAEQEFNRNGWISYFDIVVECSEPVDTFSITTLPIANYGVIHGPRILENINVTQQVVNPNILEWVSSSLSSFLDTDIFPDISIGELLFVIVAIPLAITFLKFFAGG